MSHSRSTHKPFDKSYLDNLRHGINLADFIASRGIKLHRQGAEYVACCPFHTNSGKNMNFTVRPDKQFFHCFGCGAHGDVFGFLMRHDNMKFSEAVEVIAGKAAMPAAHAPQAISKNKADDEALKAERIDRALKLWKQCIPVRGTLVETYLRARGITCPIPPVIRYHSNLRHMPSTKYFPAMVSFVQGADGKFCGVHRTYLDGTGTKKADVTPAKKMLGSWGHIRLTEAGDTLAIAEGIETALSVRVAVPTLSVWAAMALGNFGAAVPEHVKKIIFLGDADNSDQAKAEKQMRDAAQKLRGNNRTIMWCFPPSGYDFNDLLKQGTQQGGIQS